MMKKLSFYFTFLLIALAFTACNDAEEEEFNGTITATVDGTAWKSTLTSGAYNDDQRTLIFGGQNAKGDIISLSLDNVTGTGIYDAQSSVLVVGSYMMAGSDEEWTTYPTQECTITITKFDKSAKRVSGTFEFVAQNEEETSTKTITNGKFSDVLFEVY